MAENKLVTQEQLKQLLHEPYQYLVSQPAGYFRYKFAESLNVWFKVPEDVLKIIEDVCDIAHNASLLVDDVEDDSELRRGGPTAHLVYGIEVTIFSAVAMLYEAGEKIVEFEDLDLLNKLQDAFSDLLLGQEMELNWRYSGECPTEEDYCKMCHLKSGVAFSTVIKLMQSFSDCKIDMRKLVVNLGLFFQIHNDLKYLNSECPPTDKTFCEDFTEGKFNFPLIHAVRTHPEDRRIVSILRLRTKDTDLKKLLLSLLEEYGSLDYTRKSLDRLKKDILDEIETLGGNPGLVKLVNQLKF